MLIYVEQKEVFIKNLSFPVKNNSSYIFLVYSWTRSSFLSNQQNQGSKSKFPTEQKSVTFSLYILGANRDLPLKTKSVLVYKISRFHLYVYMLDPHSNSLVLHYQIFHQHNDTILF